MPKEPKPIPNRKRNLYGERSEEQDEEPPMTPERARQELGFDLLWINGGDQEVQDD